MLLSVKRDKLLAGMILEQDIFPEMSLSVGKVLSAVDVQNIQKYYSGNEILVREARLLKRYELDEIVISKVVGDILRGRAGDEAVYPLLSYLKCKGNNFLKVHQQLLDLNDFDPTTFKHCVDVAWYSLYLGYREGLSKDELEVLAQAAIMHDIGKLYINPSILSANRELTADEFNIMKKHSEYGYTWVKELFPMHIALMVRNHHEKLDGSGYPRGISNSELGKIDRIITIADCFDAMTQNRVYRDALSAFQAYSILRQDAIKGKIDRSLLRRFSSIFDLVKGCYYRHKNSGFVEFQSIKSDETVLVRTEKGEMKEIKLMEVI